MQGKGIKTTFSKIAAASCGGGLPALSYMRENNGASSRKKGSPREGKALGWQRSARESRKSRTEVSGRPPQHTRSFNIKIK